MMSLELHSRAGLLLTSFFVVRTASSWNKLSKAGRIGACCSRCHNLGSFGSTGTRRNFSEPIRSRISVLAGVPDIAKEFRLGIKDTIELCKETVSSVHTICD